MAAEVVTASTGRVQLPRRGRAGGWGLGAQADTRMEGRGQTEGGDNVWSFTKRWERPCEEVCLSL